MLTFRVWGRGARRAFAHEAGGHRWQRISPTEKRGRIHTSTVTVAVLDEKEVARVHIDPNDIDVKTCRGGGPGGQHRNTSDTAVQITHLPTGLKVRAEDNKSQHVNRENAVRLLHIRLLDAERDRMGSKRDRKRKAQVGSGMRGDKVRTVQTQNGRVTNHLNGKRIRLKEYLRGDVGALL